ncbi:unnamed protein product [Aureobasidium uvarum]|uniref:Uncharacterized protein n=1 Tax=Aureobasidium uvarum TaxID=2773716 RepID=A0A9N8KI00_9PEZI|nr:unnamed protein product [Aureobasidium uvarum]
MAPWYHPLASPLFLTGVIINAVLAFFFPCAVRNRGPGVWVPILVTMLIVGAVQAAYGKSTLCVTSDISNIVLVVLVSLCIEQPAIDPLALAVQTGNPMVEVEPFGISSSDEDNNSRQ